MKIDPKTSLSPHFTFEELTRSDTAQRLNLDNTPPFIPTLRLVALCIYTLEPLREVWGKPLYINSGYRSKEVNKAVGGVANSQHVEGEAVDIRCSDLTEAETMLRKLILHGITYDQAIIETNTNSVWLHVSCKFDKTQNRHSVIKRMTKN